MSIVDSLRKLSLKLTGACSTGEDIEDNIEYIAENYSGGGGSGSVKGLGVLPELFSGIDEQAEDPNDFAKVLIPIQTLDGDIIDSFFDLENPYLFLKMVLPEVTGTNWVFGLHDIYESGSIVYEHSDAFAPILVSKNEYDSDDITFSVTFKHEDGGQSAISWQYDPETNKYVFVEP